MDSEDERVAAVACNSILDRALGKPKAVEEEKNDMEARLAAMTSGQRLEYMRELLEPMRQHMLERASRPGIRSVRSDRARVTPAELQRRPVPPAAAHVGTAVLPLGAPTARDAETDQ
jgi:hypothetical protein